MKLICSLIIAVYIGGFLNPLQAQTTSLKLADGYYLTANDGIKVYDKYQKVFFYLDKTSLIPIRHVKSTEVNRVDNLAKVRYELSSSLDAFGTSALANFSPNFDRTTNIALVINGEPLFVAGLLNKITSGRMSFSSGKLTKTEVEKMKSEIDKAIAKK
ncbi:MULTISPECIES: hypothetical protein [unclassified Pedobacter]|jgi:hypothetical protein|uniref:hypothetical protein n=1 Tax=unclassified Pedobacter TaxID=2628915 RepID=UPI001D311E24|nr:MULTISPECIES: hypothetical protein [unclassified Pedobacter]CAH0158444.1 hypothetical protein SRABI36_00974 [Pedobacter sp. Bi36]CAH0214796.1 hypothetical protein SRABI126_02065 [Pedobacter sp. Bi126]